MDAAMSSDRTGGTGFTPEEDWDMEVEVEIGVRRVGVAIPDNEALLVLVPMLTREGREEREPGELLDSRHLSHNTYISNVNAYM